MDRYGDHARANCKHGFGWTARHNVVAAVFRSRAIFLSAIQSTRELVGLLPGCSDRPADLFIPTGAGCTTNDGGQHTGASFDFTVRAVWSDAQDVNAALKATARQASRAAGLAESDKVAAFTRRGEDVALSMNVNEKLEWKPHFQFRPFAMDEYGALGPVAAQAATQFARVQDILLHQAPDYCRPEILQEVSVALHSANAKMLRCRRPQLTSPETVLTPEDSVLNLQVGGLTYLTCCCYNKRPKRKRKRKRKGDIDWLNRGTKTMLSEDVLS